VVERLVEREVRGGGGDPRVMSSRKPHRSQGGSGVGGRCHRRLRRRWTIRRGCGRATRRAGGERRRPRSEDDVVGGAGGGKVRHEVFLSRTGEACTRGGRSL
jgi:hypothetical protein